MANLKKRNRNGVPIIKSVNGKYYKKKQSRNTGKLAESQIENRLKPEQRGRKALSEAMKSDMLNIKKRFLECIKMANNFVNVSHITWKQIQDTLLKFTCSENSCKFHAVNSVFKKKKSSFPSKEMYRAMKLGVSDYPQNKATFYLNHIPGISKDIENEASSSRDAAEMESRKPTEQKSLNSFFTKVEKKKKVHFPYSLIVHLSACAMLDEDGTSVEEVIEDNVFKILNNEKVMKLMKMPKTFELEDLIEVVKKNMDTIDE